MRSGRTVELRAIILYRQTVSKRKLSNMGEVGSCTDGE